MDFEKKLKRLEEIVNRMEKGDLALDESLQLFEEGVRLSRECQKRLAEADEQVKKLSGFDHQGRAVLESFQESEQD